MDYIIYKRKNWQWEPLLHPSFLEFCLQFIEHNQILNLLMRHIVGHFRRVCDIIVFRQLITDINNMQDYFNNVCSN
jgi:hypothetical protein